MAIVEYVSEDERAEIVEKLSKAICRGASEEELSEIDARLPLARISHKPKM